MRSAANEKQVGESGRGETNCEAQSSVECLSGSGRRHWWKGGRRSRPFSAAKPYSVLLSPPGGLKRVSERVEEKPSELEFHARREI